MIIAQNKFDENNERSQTCCEDNETIESLRNCNYDFFLD